MIIEDGSIVKNANSFIDLEDARDYADQNGLSLPESDDELSTLLIRSATWLRGKNWKGTVVAFDQPLPWPRNISLSGASRWNFGKIPNNFVPFDILYAQVEMAALMHGGEDPFAVLERGGRVQSESVINGLQSISYFDDAPNVSVYPVIDALLKMYLSGDGSFSTVPVEV